MHRWTVGDAEVVRIEDLDFVAPSERVVPDWCVPDLARSTSEVGIAFSALTTLLGGSGGGVVRRTCEDRFAVG